MQGMFATLLVNTLASSCKEYYRNWPLIKKRKICSSNPNRYQWSKLCCNFRFQIRQLPWYLSFETVIDSSMLTKLFENIIFETNFKCLSSSKEWIFLIWSLLKFLFYPFSKVVLVGPIRFLRCCLTYLTSVIETKSSQGSNGEIPILKTNEKSLIFNIFIKNKIWHKYIIRHLFS